MTVHRTIPAGEFKAKCLKLMDELAREGGELVITKRGKPVVRMTPLEPPKATRESFFGRLAGTMEIRGDIVAPLEDEWNADKDDAVLGETV
jgi:prevent-host-death family protein